MNEQQFYEKVGKANGWNFSQLQVEVQGETWDFYNEAADRAPRGVLLDIGSGGGENLLRAADRFAFAVGIDRSEAMVEAARINLQKTALQNVRFTQMAAENLQFPSGFFDAVTSRHCSFDAHEAARVLNPGGVLLTQQVGEADKANVKEAFSRGQAYSERNGCLKERYESELRAAGFKQVQSLEYDAAEYYRRPEDLLFLLQHTPIIPDFGEQPDDWEKFRKFIEKNRTPKGIQTNSRRFLLIAYK